MTSSHAPHRRRPAARAAIAGIAALAGIAAALLAGASEPARAADQPPGPLQATLEILRPFCYEGDPLMIRVAVFNTGDQPYDNAAGINLLGGLNVSSASRGKLALKTKPAADPKRQPAVIPPGGFFGIIQDIASVVPDLSKADTYSITWEAAGLKADPVTVKVIPKFDPEAGYVAVIETDLGYLEFELKAKEAPKHVQNFYDLASQGLYNNTILHQVLRGVEVRGGDPAASGVGLPGYGLEPEVTRELKHRRGTLSAVRLPGQRQDSASQFVITLAPREEYDGNLSVFGQMTKGEDALAAIEGLPTTGQYDFPYYRPLKPIVLRSVVVRKIENPKAG